VTLTLVATNASPRTYALYEVKRSWSEASATWLLAATGAPWAVPGARGATDRGTTVLGTITPSTTGARTITLDTAGTALVQRWIDTPSSNRGVLVVDSVNTDGADFRSREDPTVSLRPKLVITTE
jgi:hypothetical protein